MFSPDDTIVAVATPEGRGALGVVRISGPDAHRIALDILGRSKALPPRQAVLGLVRPDQALSSEGATGTAGRTIDQVVALFFQGPKSYSGEDTVELTAHGGYAVLRALLGVAVARGARLARPGEFTFRAYLNGRLDLVQAEAVADLIEAVTASQAQLAFDQLRGTLSQDIAAIEARVFQVVVRLEASLDFPDEGYHFAERTWLLEELTSVVAQVSRLVRSGHAGRVIREGRVVAIVGRPNVGKSSLFNALVGSDRAIVTSIAGTTRDLLTERVEIGGVPVTLVDSAGIHETPEPVEQEGVRRARAMAEDADVRILVLDRTRALEETDRALLSSLRPDRSLVVVHKVDQDGAWTDVDAEAQTVLVSSRTGHGVDSLRKALGEVLLGGEWTQEQQIVSNVRHLGLLTRALSALERARDAAHAGVPEEFVLVELKESQQALAEVTGERTPQDVLTEIFSRFCIGK